MGLFKKSENSKGFEKFIKTYLKDECEGESFEIIALTGFLIIGASKSKDAKFYSSNVNCLAYIDSNNQLVEDEIKLFYFLDDTSTLKYLKISDLTPYKFTVKKVKNKNLYYIVEFNGFSATTQFNSIIEEQTKQLSIIEDNYTFNFNRTLNLYEANIVIDDKNISVMLCAKQNSTDASKSLETFKTIKNDFKNFYHKVLSQCSNNMVNLANDWREDGDTHEITAEEIYNRIDGDFDITIIDKDYSIYFNDDDIFWGHSILYSGNIESDKFDTTIAG